MLRELFIQNYAIIEKLNIGFSPQFTVVTGETGAGKSILLGALSMVLGHRADTKVLYDEKLKCIVEATFDVSKYGLVPFFDAHELDFSDECIIRREISPNGKSRAFINDTPVRLTTMQALSNFIIDVHRQFDTQKINSAHFQLQTVDALAQHKPLLKEYQTKFDSYKKAQKEAVDLKEKQAESLRQKEFVLFQLNELIELELTAGEQNVLEQEKRSLSKAEDVKSFLGESAHFLTESETSIVANLNDILSSIQKLEGISPKIDDLIKRFNETIIEIEDISSTAQDLSEGAQLSPQRLEEVENRLDSIYVLEQKHNVQTLEELMVLQDKFQEDLASFEGVDDQLKKLEKFISKAQAELNTLAKKLNKNRVGQVKDFEKKVIKLLVLLGMEYGNFKVDISKGSLNKMGFDEVQFLFSANKGHKLSLIKDVASGGELSRLTLAIKSLVANAIPLPTIIFDEIETGISGEIAHKMSEILKDLSKQHQIISITHAPQIAAKGDKHYFIYKDVQNNRTFTRVNELNGEEKVMEIAKMLSGANPSKYAIENAKDLMLN